jgi:hypothetical protein
VQVGKTRRLVWLLTSFLIGLALSYAWSAR